MLLQRSLLSGPCCSTAPRCGRECVPRGSGKKKGGEKWCCLFSGSAAIDVLAERIVACTTRAKDMGFGIHLLTNRGSHLCDLIRSRGEQPWTPRIVAWQPGQASLLGKGSLRDRWGRGRGTGGVHRLLATGTLAHRARWHQAMWSRLRRSACPSQDRRCSLQLHGDHVLSRASVASASTMWLQMKSAG